MLSADGWLDTGDLGYLVDGEIVLTGRGQGPDHRSTAATSGRRTWNGPPRPRSTALRSGDVAAFSVAREARTSRWWCWSSPAPATRRSARRLQRRGRRRAARRATASRPRCELVGAARPAPDLVRQAQPLEGRAPPTWPAPSSWSAPGLSRGRRAWPRSPGPPASWAATWSAPWPTRAGACASWPAATRSSPLWRDSDAGGGARRPGRRRRRWRRLCDGADVVVHVAGLIKARKPRDFDAVNVEGARRVAEAAAAAAPHLLLVSSLAAREPRLSHYARQQARRRRGGPRACWATG